jgi:hypothetical protein
MVFIYRAAGLVLFLATFAAVSHNTQIFNHLFIAKPETGQQQTQTPIANTDKIKEVKP